MSDQGEGACPPLRGDEADLFREFNRQFVRTVQRRTNAPREIVDDACGLAWQQFMRYQPDRDRNWRAWMLTTAEREAWRLRGIEAGHLSLSVGDGAESRDVGRTGPARPVAIRMRLLLLPEGKARVEGRLDACGSPVDVGGVRAWVAASCKTRWRGSTRRRLSVLGPGAWGMCAL